MNITYRDDIGYTRVEILDTYGFDFYSGFCRFTTEDSSGNEIEIDVPLENIVSIDA